MALSQIYVNFTKGGEAKKTSIRIVALVLVLVMALSLAACSFGGNKETTPSTTPSTNAPTGTTAPSTSPEFDPLTYTDGVTITIAVEADDEVEDWNTNLTTLAIEEKFGEDIQFEVYAADTFFDKMSLMIEGGDKLPDIIFDTGNTAKGLQSVEARWTSSGAIRELSDFFANPDLAKYVNIAIEKEGVDFVSHIKDAEGKIWGMPHYYPGTNDATAYRLWINEEYAKACGFDELPTTTEGFFELCKAFAAAGDLNGNGLDDEAVFSGPGKIQQPWFRFLMTPFVDAWDNEYMELTNGKIEAAYATDGWKEGLKYIKQFFDEGLIDSTIITQDKAAYNAIVQDPSMRVLAHVDYRPRMVGETNLDTLNCRLAYSWVPALTGPRGVAEAYYSDPVAYNAAMITEACENPEAAFIILDYMMSQEISIQNRYGQEGVDWDWWENVDDSKFIDGTTKDMYIADNGEEPEYVS